MLPSTSVKSVTLLSAKHEMRTEGKGDYFHSLGIWLGENLLYSQFLKELFLIQLNGFFPCQMQGVLGAGSESLFLHLNAKTTRLQSQDSSNCCPNSPTNLVFSTTQQPSSCKQDGVFSSAQFSWQVVKQYRGFRMKRDLNPAFPQPGQGIFKVLRLLPAACVQWCQYFQCTQRTLTRPKALSTGDIYAILPNIWIYIKRTQTQNAQLLIPAPH